ncbi:MAG: RNA polymerase sigma factor RpoH [Pseudomonadota bacterium]
MSPLKRRTSMSTALVPTQNNLLNVSPLGNLDSYIHAVSGVPVLSAQEERDLATEFQQDGNLQSARQLVISNLRFVVHIARGYGGYGLPLGDLVQEGNVGLMKAVKRFDPTVGVRLVSFAVHWIRAEIHEFVLRNWRLVKVATTKAQRKLFFNLRKSKSHLGWLSQDETRSVASDLGVSEREVTEMEQRLSARDLGYDQPSDNDDDNVTFAPAAYLASPGGDPASLIEQHDWEQDAQSQLLDALDGLDERSQDIIKKRWLSEKKTTLKELAEQYNVSAERIRQIENNAMKTMRGAVNLS